jgi:hypothetical protein
MNAARVKQFTATICLCHVTLIFTRILQAFHRINKHTAAAGEQTALSSSNVEFVVVKLYTTQEAIYGSAWIDVSHHFLHSKLCT